MPRASRDVLPNHIWPLTLGEQRRVVATIEEHMTTVERNRQALEGQLVTSNARPAARLRRAFSSER